MDRLRGNPTLVRWLPLLVIPPVLLLDGLLSTKGDGAPVDLLDVPLTYAAALPLVLRHRLGFAGMAPLLVIGVIALLQSYEPGTTVVLLPAWALFDLARKRGRREALMSAGLVVPCVIVSVIPFCDNAAEAVSVSLRNVALCELAILAGYFVWHNRAAMERERAANEADAQRRLGDERLRIAREVHDVVAHSMVAINVQAGVAAHLIDRDTDQAREALLHIKRTSGDALMDLRATLGILRDPDREAPTAPSAGLGDLDDVAAQLRAAGVEVDVDVDTIGPIPTPVQAAAYRIVQESLTNVLRHAGARAATVVVRADEDMLTIVVADDGAGHAAATTGAGAGVRGMRERATALGGTLDSGPGAEGGWLVEATLPLARAGASA